MKICLIDGCSDPVKTRGLCKPHYGQHHNAGTVDLVGAPKVARHYLSNKNKESMTGDCAICGPNVPLLVQRYKNTGKENWLCKTKETERMKGRPNGYFPYGDGKFIPIAVAEKARVEFLEKQGGLCAICGKPDETVRRMSLDHCHDTGKLRGMLCNGCNVGIGMLGDDPDRVLAAYNYLLKHK
jgi:Recombination endonuclease VII